MLLVLIALGYLLELFLLLVDISFCPDKIGAEIVNQGDQRVCNHLCASQLWLELLRQCFCRIFDLSNGECGGNERLDLLRLAS